MRQLELKSDNGISQTKLMQSVSIFRYMAANQQVVSQPLTVITIRQRIQQTALVEFRATWAAAKYRNLNKKKKIYI